MQNLEPESVCPDSPSTTMDLDRGGVAMESTTDEKKPSHPPAPLVGADSSVCPRSVLLPCYGKRTNEFSVVANANTTSAVSRTSTGQRFHVCFGLAPSPEISSFSYAWEDLRAREHDIQGPIVLTAQGDCVLLEVTKPSKTRSSISLRPEYFLYQASAAGRPPSLMLLPPCYYPRLYERRGGESPPKPRDMVQKGTAILRRGDGDILVAQLELDLEKPEKELVELCLLRPGRDRDWQLVTRLHIVVHDDDNNGSRDESQGASEDDGPLRWWCTDAAFAVGDRFLCWVDNLRGFLFIDMEVADESSNFRLRYVPLPVEPPYGDPDAEDDRSNMVWTRNLAAAGDGAVRFVDVDSRCCCGDPGSTTCERGRFFFTVATWTLKLSVDGPMEWVKDGVLDCDELWAQPGYTGLPRVTVEYPIVVDSDYPDAVCFVVHSEYRWYSGDQKAWTIVVDTRRKVLLSVVLFNHRDIPHPRSSFFPAKIQN